jgi:hypothetical protein
VKGEDFSSNTRVVNDSVGKDFFDGSRQGSEMMYGMRLNSSGNIG